VNGSEKSQFFGAEISVQTWRWTELMQVLEVTTTGSHTGRRLLKLALD